MVLLLVKLLLITAAVELAGVLGKARLIDFLYAAWLKISPSPLQRQQRTLQREILALRAELRGTSSQDEFAKWAKTRRKVDKSVADLEKLNGNAAQAKAAFGKIVTALHFIAITALPFAFSSYHSKSAVFYLPQGWFGPAEWFLGLPFAPAGAVSCAVWTMFAKRGVRVVGSAAWELVEGVLAPAQPAAKPVAVPAQPSEKASSSGGAGKEKEL